MRPTSLARCTRFAATLVLLCLAAVAGARADETVVSRPRQLLPLHDALVFTGAEGRELRAFEWGHFGVVWRGRSAHRLGDLFVLREESRRSRLCAPAVFQHFLQLNCSEEVGGLGKLIALTYRRALFETTGQRGTTVWAAFGGDHSIYLAPLQGHRAGTPTERLQTAACGEADCFFATTGRTGDASIWRLDEHYPPRAVRVSRAPFSDGVQLLGVTPRGLVFAPRARPTELWFTDGSPDGARPLANLAGPSRLTVLTATTSGAHVYFSTEDAHRRRELWASDGTRPGTRRVLSSSVAEPLPEALVAQGSLLRNGLVFVARDDAHGAEPWITDGTAAGTRLLIDACPGPCSSGATLLASSVRQDLVVFSAEHPETGMEPWLTDGTAAGTRTLGDLCPGRCSSVPALVEESWIAENDLEFSLVASDGAGNRALWLAGVDGTLRLTPAGTSVLTAMVGGYVDWNFAVFAARDHGGDRLWRTQGTPESTERWPLGSGEGSLTGSASNPLEP